MVLKRYTEFHGKIEQIHFLKILTLLVRRAIINTLTPPPPPPPPANFILLLKLKILVLPVIKSGENTKINRQKFSIFVHFSSFSKMA